METKFNSSIIKLADHLNGAREKHAGVSPIISEEPSLTLKDAYHIQLYNVGQQLESGKEIVGKKIGLTSRAMQDSLGVDEPDYGHLLNDMVISSDSPVIYSDQVLQPRVEGELAFVLNKDLVGPHVTVEDVLDATESIVPAIEIVDSRVKDWKITLSDTVADNGSSAYYILGDTTFPPEEFDRIGVQMKLLKNGEVINGGSGKDVLGDPAYCVAWLANKLYEFNIGLKADQVILSGALSAAVPAKAGDTFTCRFTEDLGEVEISFKERKVT